MAFPKVVSAWSEGARARSVSGHATRSAHRAVPAYPDGRRESGKEARKAVRVVRASRARIRRVFVRRVEKKFSSCLDRVPSDSATPRPRARRRNGRTAGRPRGVAARFAGERRATYPVTTPRWLSARWCTPSCRSGRRLRGRGGSSVGPSVGTSEARARERGGERTARLTRQREYRQRRDRLPVSCGRPRLRHDRLSGARARGAPLVLSRDVSRQQWRSHRKIAKGRLFASSSKT